MTSPYFTQEQITAALDWLETVKDTGNVLAGVALIELMRLRNDEHTRADIAKARDHVRQMIAAENET